MNTSQLVSFLSELKLYHHVTSNMNVLKHQREEFYVTKSLSKLDLEYSHLKQTILDGDQLPSLCTTYARMMHSGLKILTPSMSL